MGLFLKFTVYIVKIDKKQNPLKFIAENGSSLSQCIWIFCQAPELVCGGGGYGIETPCTYLENLARKQTNYI